MHPSSLEEMKKFFAMLQTQFKDSPINMLDVGSQDVNGGYNKLIANPLWCYTGVDLYPGNNVNIMGTGYSLPFIDCVFDAVISGQTLEHVGRPWVFMPELERVLKPGGYMCVVAPHTFKYHTEGGSPDCWRVWPDGMRDLIIDTCPEMDILEIYRNNIDTVFIGRKEMNHGEYDTTSSLP